MHPDDVRELFDSIDVVPRAAFAESLLTRLRSEQEGASLLTGVGVERAIPEPIDLDLPAGTPTSAHRERLHGRRNRRLAAAVAAIAVIVGCVAVATRDDGMELANTEVDEPSTTLPAPTTVPPRMPAGLHALPPEGAVPSLPVIGELLAELPMPIWVYKDGRVISARWSGGEVPGDWSGFLEQRLTPEGVELVRAEIDAADPLSGFCKAGGPGGYGFSDGGRAVCAHATVGGWETVYPRLYELPDGAPSWLPADAWAQPVPRIYVPSVYAIQVEVDEGLTRDDVVADLPPALAEMLAVAPECDFDIFPFDGERLCWKVTTDEARAFVDAEGFGAQYDRGTLMGPGWGYFFDVIPYLPHDKAVWCCGG